MKQEKKTNPVEKPKDPYVEIKRYDQINVLDHFVPGNVQLVVSLNNEQAFLSTNIRPFNALKLGPLHNLLKENRLIEQAKKRGQVIGIKGSAGPGLPIDPHPVKHGRTTWNRIAPGLHGGTLVLPPRDKGAKHVPAQPTGGL